MIEKTFQVTRSTTYTVTGAEGAEPMVFEVETELVNYDSNIPAIDTETVDALISQETERLQNERQAANSSRIGGLALGGLFGGMLFTGSLLFDKGVPITTVAGGSALVGGTAYLLTGELAAQISRFAVRRSNKQVQARIDVLTNLNTAAVPPVSQ